MNYYSKTHTINVWVKIILDKFNDINFDKREVNIAKILGITSNPEINKIKEASLIAFGKTLGIETFEDACNKIGKSTNIPKLVELDIEIAIRFISEYKLIVIIRALNEGWYPNWSNTNEYKYFPYFNMTDGDCGFSYWDTYYFDTNANVPSALLLKTSELALYCGQKFLPLYKDYYK